MRVALGLVAALAAQVAAAQVYKPATVLPYSGLAGLTPSVGMEVFVTNCRAITGVAALASGFSTQAAGSGTGCLATWNGSGWVIAGTTMAVTQ